MDFLYTALVYAFGDQDEAGRLLQGLTDPNYKQKSFLVDVSGSWLTPYVCKAGAYMHTSLVTSHHHPVVVHPHVAVRLFMGGAWCVVLWVLQRLHWPPRAVDAILKLAALPPKK